MRIGSTAIEAIVRLAPATVVSPNVIPAASSAMASGSRRSRLRNTIRSEAAMTSTAAISSLTIEPASEEARSLTTTGSPVTVYEPP